MRQRSVLQVATAAAMKHPDPRETSSPAPLVAGSIPLLTLAAAVATSTSYAVQPELAHIATDLEASVASTSAAAGLPIVGYMLGLGLLVPLVDRVAANRLVPAQLAALGASMVLTAAATSVELFGAGLFLSGVFASTGAQMSTLAAKHSPIERRGRALGTVTAGISVGILAGRMLGGALTDVMGWRAMLAVLAGVCLLCAGGARAFLPKRLEPSPDSWLSDLLSAPQLLRTHPGLAIAASAGALWFFAFSLIWVGVSLALSLPPLGLSPTAVGLYSLAGLSGMAATPAAGQLADRFGSGRIVVTGLVVALVCDLAMWPALGLAPLLLFALALFDAGLFAAQVANQRRVLSMDPTRPGQLNSTYMVIYFVGGSVGAATGGPLVSTFGWPAAVGVAGLAITLALALYMARPFPPER